MNNEDINKMIAELCSLKRFAIKEGQAQHDPETLRKKISATSLTSGDVAEVWMAYMLGLFSAIADDGLRIYVTTSLDKEGVDFCLKRFRTEYYVQMKFCKKNTRYYPDYIKVVEVGAWKGFKGLTELPHYLGNYAVFDILLNSGAYDDDELYEIFESREDFVAICDEVWTYITG